MNMDNVKYSFIVPVYNGEKYLNECINSILAQTAGNFEIVIVDDGSKDKSGEICDGFAAVCDNVSVFHIENGGVSNARNFGISQAKGKYLCFVDCDDTVSCNLLKTAEKCDGTDLIITGYTRESAQQLCAENTNIGIKNLDGKEREKIVDKIIYDSGKAMPQINCSTVWAKLYKTEIIKKNACAFPKNIKIGEDKLFNFAAVSRCKSISYVDAVMYYCRTHGGSVMMSKSDGYFKMGLDTFTILFDMINKLPESSRGHYNALCAQRMVLIIKNALMLDWCHSANKKPYKERKRGFDTAMQNETVKKLISQCNAQGLKNYDKFFLKLYKSGFFFVNLAMKNKAAKAAFYAVYKILNLKG